MPTSFLPSLPSHQKIHTHANIILSPFDVYINHSLQFTMLVWESVFSWLAISKKADLWRHNCKLTFSIQLLSAQLILLQGLSFFGGWAYLLFWFCLLLWLWIIFWYPFRLWFSFLRDSSRKNSLIFLFSLPSSTEWHMIGFSFSRFLLEVFWPSSSYSMPWKTREGY